MGETENDNKSYRRLELSAFLLILGVAAFFRLWLLDGIPPGLHFDEAIDMRQGLNILTGARPIYVMEGWGREALYYYLLAAVLLIVPSNVLALRLTAVLCSLATFLVTYRFIRRVANPLTAWFTTGWTAVIFWSVFTSRLAVRNISLPLLFNLTVAAFWWAWKKNKTSDTGVKVFDYSAAGILLGLTLYTYQPARFAPIIFALFFLYLLLFHRDEFRASFWGFLLFGGVALLVALPLIITISNNPVEGAERAWIIEPLTESLAGNYKPVMQNIMATVKMFTISGDPLNSYNVPGRPVFQPAWTGLFFYGGLLLAWRRWKQPLYAFILIWLVIMLAPTVLTISAPNFNRTLAAQTAVMFLAALPIAELAGWTARRHKRAALIPLLVGGVALLVTAVSTYHDYFNTWPQSDTVTVQYNAAINDIARYLYDNSNPRPLVINSRNLEDADPYILTVSLDRPDLNIRWSDTGQALVLPDGERELRLIVADGRWVDSDLSNFADLPPAGEYHTRFALFDFSVAEWETGTTAPLYTLPAGVTLPADPAREATFIQLPISFQDKVTLESIHLSDMSIKPGQTLTFITTWTVQQRGDPIPMAIFTHLLNSQEQIVGQQDGLGFPPHSWRPGDQFIHVHHIPLAADLPPGNYWLQFGYYHRQTGERWLVWEETNSPLGDRLLLGPFTLD